MVRHWKIGAAAAALLVLPAASGVVSAQALMKPYQPPNYQAVCTEGVKKLDTGIEVIGASAAKIRAAQADSATAKKQMATSNWYSCATAAKKGLQELDAG